jgi:hypothetical protein
MHEAARTEALRESGGVITIGSLQSGPSHVDTFLSLALSFSFSLSLSLYYRRCVVWRDVVSVGRRRGGIVARESRESCVVR